MAIGNDNNVGAISANWFFVPQDKNDIGSAQTGGAYISRGSSEEFERKHGTDWFAKAVNNPTC